MTALSQAAAPSTGRCTRGRRAPGIQALQARLFQPRPSPEPYHFAGTRPPLFRDFAERLPALGCPGAPRAEPRDPPQLQPLGLPGEIPALTLYSEIAQSPFPGFWAPPPCFASDQWAQGLPGSSGGATPLPNDTISLIGLAVRCVPKPVCPEHF